MVTDKDQYTATTIAELVDYFGGYATVARILNVTVEDLHRWSEGKARPPAHVFVRLIAGVRR
jgi:hypothetical protein